MQKLTLNTIYDNPYTALLVGSKNNAEHLHDFWEITWSINGMPIHYVNNHSFDMLPYSGFLIIRPGDVHRIDKEQNRTAELFRQRDIYVDDEKMRKICNFIDEDLYDSLVQSATPIFVSIKNNLLEALEATLNLFNSFERNRQEISNNLPLLHTSVVSTLLGAYIENKIHLAQQRPKWIEDFFKKLTSEEFLTKTIEDIISELAYSHSYVCRSFKKYVGKTMVQVLNEAKLRYSTILLMEKDISILDVAYRLNYKSQSAYITAFKKMYQYSPYQWRKINLKQKQFTPQEHWGETETLYP